MDNHTSPSIDAHQPSSSSTQLNFNPKTPSRTHLVVSGINSASPSRTIYGDRFIPSRSSSKFELFNVSLPPHSSSEDSSNAYTTLLRAALFGPDSGAVLPPLTPESSARNLHSNSLNCNIFRYKTETRKSVHSLFPFGFDDQLPGVSPSPVKAPRKVPRSPFKVKSLIWGCFALVLIWKFVV